MKMTAVLTVALLGLSSGLATAAPVTAPAASTAASTGVVRIAGGLYQSHCPPPRPHMFRACPIIRWTGWKPLRNS